MRATFNDLTMTFNTASPYKEVSVCKTLQQKALAHIIAGPVVSQIKVSQRLSVYGHGTGWYQIKWREDEGSAYVHYRIPDLTLTKAKEIRKLLRQGEWGVLAAHREWDGSGW